MITNDKQLSIARNRLERLEKIKDGYEGIPKREWNVKQCTIEETIRILKKEIKEYE